MIDVVAAYIKNDTLILLTQRAKGELKGLWEFPGGKVNENETQFTAIKREIKEELSIDVSPKKIIKTFFYKYPFCDIQLTLIECTLDNNNQEIFLDDSQLAYTWVSLIQCSLPLAPLDKLIIEYLKELH